MLLLHAEVFSRIKFLLNNWERRFYIDMYNQPCFSEKQMIKIKAIHNKIPETLIQDMEDRIKYFEYGRGHLEKVFPKPESKSKSKSKCKK
jgi:hypothetical protein